MLCRKVFPRKFWSGFRDESDDVEKLVVISLQKLQQYSLPIFEMSTSHCFGQVALGVRRVSPECL